MSVEAGLAAALPRERSERSILLGRFLRQRSAVIGGTIVLLVTAVALLAPLLAPYPYDATDILNPFAPPDATNLLGTDKLGRDILSRLIIGARVSLVIGVSVMAIT